MAYIDKELFKQDIKMRYCNNCARPNEIKCRACHIDDMLGEIEDAPTADVAEVVRCKNCTNWTTCHTCEEFTTEVLSTGGRKTFITAPDFFCGYGKRKISCD